MFNSVMKPYGNALAKAGQNVYAYKFNYATEANIETGLGAHHGSEIACAFGNLPDDATDEQKALSKEMFTRWANFIKSGDPDTEGGVAWPKYDAGGTQMLLLDKEVEASVMPDKEDFAFMAGVMFE